MANNNNFTENITDWRLSAEILYNLYAMNDYAIIALYVPVYILALIANVIIIIVVFKDQYMRSVTNYFLVNLSIADLLVTLVCMPNAAWQAYTTVYNFGEYTCKIVVYMQCISVASSIFTITAMAIDRYLAINRPFGMIYRCFSKSTTITVIISLWLFSLFLFSPVLWIYKLREDKYPVIDENITIFTCITDWKSSLIPQQTLGIVWFIFMFAKPGIIMVYAYSMMGKTLCSGMPAFDTNEAACTQQRNRVVKGRKRIACILLLLAFVFFFCWLPYHIMNLIRDTASFSSSDSSSNKTAMSIQRYLLLLGHTNSALNPIIYCVLSRKFRTSIRNLLRSRGPFKRKRQLVKWADSSGSGTQMHYLHHLRTTHRQLQTHVSLTNRISSSQKMNNTKTIAV